MWKQSWKPKFLFPLGVLVLMMSPSTVLADEYTVTQKVSQFRYDANADYVFIKGAAPWGAPSCPSATYAQVQNFVSGRRQLLAIVLAANLASKRVTFQGSCDAAPGYFNINYVTIED